LSEDKIKAMTYSKTLTE